LLTHPVTHDAIGSAVIALTVDLEEHFQVSGFESVIPRERWPRFESRLERNTMLLLEILASHSASATFFVLAWNAERYPGLVRRIHAAGHEIACHSYAHHLVYRQTPEEFRQDTRRAKGILEALIGQPVVGYRAPSFSITRKSLWALNILADEGFQYDSSIFPILRDRYGIPGAPRFPYRIPVGNGSPVLKDSRADSQALSPQPSALSPQRLEGSNLPAAGCPLDSHSTDSTTQQLNNSTTPSQALSPQPSALSPQRLEGSDLPAAGCPLDSHSTELPTQQLNNSILEIPPSTIRFLGLTLPLGGGGYLRLFPEPLFRNALERILIAQRQMAVLYVHPWELDPEQPRVLRGSWLSTFRQYVNLHKTEGRLRRLLATFPSVSIRTVLPRLTAEAGTWAPAAPRAAEPPAERYDTRHDPR